MQITNISQLNSVIFKDKANVSFGRKFVSLFPGLGYAAGYKVRYTHTPLLNLDLHEPNLTIVCIGPPKSIQVRRSARRS